MTQQTVEPHDTPLTIRELHYQVCRYCAYQVTLDAFREWLEPALVRTKGDRSKTTFTQRDLRKLIFFGFQLKRYRSIAIARQQLIQDLENNSCRYEDEPTINVA